MKRILAIVPQTKEITAEHPNDIELETIHPVNNYSSFILHIIVKKGNHKWINEKLHFECGSTAVGSKWITRIQDLISGMIIIEFCQHFNFLN